jgi:hypothetical protein
MSQFITVTLAKGSEEGLEIDTPVTINTHYIMKVSASTEDDHGNTAIAMASGEFLFVVETTEDVIRVLGAAKI